MESTGSQQTRFLLELAAAVRPLAQPKLWMAEAPTVALSGGEAESAVNRSVAGRCMHSLGAEPAEDGTRPVKSSLSGRSTRAFSHSNSFVRPGGSIEQGGDAKSCDRHRARLDRAALHRVLDDAVMHGRELRARQPPCNLNGASRVFRAQNLGAEP
jgi:hypothetical protein